MKKIILYGVLAEIILNILSFGAFAQSDTKNSSGMFLVVATVIDKNTGQIIVNPPVGSSKDRIVVLSDKKVKDGTASFYGLFVQILDAQGEVHTHQTIIDHLGRKTLGLVLCVKNFIAPADAEIQACFIDDEVGRIIVAYSYERDLIVQSFELEKQIVPFFTSLKPTINLVDTGKKTTSQKTIATYESPNKLHININGACPDTIVVTSETIYLPVKTKQAEQTVVEKKDEKIGKEKSGVDISDKSKQGQFTQIPDQIRQEKSEKEAAQTSQEKNIPIFSSFNFIHRTPIGCMPMSFKFDIYGAQKGGDMIFSFLAPISFARTLEIGPLVRSGINIGSHDIPQWLVGFGVSCNYFPIIGEKNLPLNSNDIKGRIYGIHISYNNSFSPLMKDFNNYTRYGFRAGVIISDLKIRARQKDQFDDEDDLIDGLHILTERQDVTLFIELDHLNDGGNHFNIIGFGTEITF